MLKGADNPDMELVDLFLRSPDPKEWRIWKKRGSKELPLEADTYSALIRIFPNIAEIEVRILELFERNDTSATNRYKMSISMVSLPALELRFQDPDCEGLTYVGFIEGRENLNNFLKMLVAKISS